MAEQYREIVDPAAENNPHAIALRFVGADHRVLEVGCAMGHVTEHLVAAGNTVVGIEIDPAAAEEARRVAERVHVLDLDVTPAGTVEHGRFDVILLGDVLEHLRDPQAALADLVTLLEPDGRLVVSVPHVGHVDVRLMLLQGRWEYRDTGLLDRTHLRWFTRDSLRELLASTGFVATRLERVTCPTFCSGLPIDTDAVPAAVIELVQADPEAHTFQFVVEARRIEGTAGDASDGSGVDVLAPGPPVTWPRVVRGSEYDELERYARELQVHDAGLAEHVAALEAELDAWRGSRLARLTAPIRSLRARLGGGARR